MIELDGNRGQSQKIVRDQAGGEHRACPHRRNTEASQYPLFAESHQLHAQAPEASHHRKRKHHRPKIRHSFGTEPPEKPCIAEEKRERHDQAEKQKRAIAHGQAHAAHRERPGMAKDAAQSRNLLPVSSRKMSSSDGAEISRLTSSLFCSSRCFTRATIVRGTRVEYSR